MESSVLTQSADVGILYEQYRDLLLHVACRKFRVPDSDAENLMQEVFLAYMQTEARVENTKAWLVAAMCIPANTRLRSGQLIRSPSRLNPPHRCLPGSMP